ncbi:transposase domain protein [Burkholderia cenocepacia K56-2Valvano]|nr:transposase domain protein [Burkholderia cenocepacia K56-2Valvano]
MLELRQQFPLAGLLRVAGLARSTFYYQCKALAAPDRHASVKAKIRALFEQHKGALWLSTHHAGAAPSGADD